MCTWIIFSVFLITTTNAFTDKNVLDCLEDHGLTGFVKLLQDAKVSSQLTGTGPFTVLAPTNAAMSALDPDIASHLSTEPVLMKQVAQYHLLQEYKVLPQLLSEVNTRTIEGQNVTFTGYGKNIVINNSSRPVHNTSDIICNNGIIHTIDKVLIPPVFSTNNVASVLLIRDDKFRDMFMALLLNNLTHLLEGSEFTLFAPTDLAFGRYSQVNNINPQMPNAAYIYHEVFKYHIVPGRRTSGMLHDGQKIYTMHGFPITIHKHPNGDIMVDHAKVEEADIPASNGVIHAIDHLIFPTDLLSQLVQTPQG